MRDYDFPRQYNPLSAWEYFGLSILYAIPIVGLIFLIIHTFSSSNINRRSFARSYWCKLLLLLILFGAFYGIALATGRSTEFQNAITESLQNYTSSGVAASGNSASSGSNTSLAGVKKSSYDSYSSIYQDYAQRITSATPGLIDEYNREAASNTKGLEGLAEISNAKVEKLAIISNEGVEEMATYMMTKGSGNYEEYQEWATMLYNVYMEEAQKITNAYMNSAMGSLGS